MVRNSNVEVPVMMIIVSWTFIEVPLCARHHAKLFCILAHLILKNAMKMYCYSYYINQKKKHKEFTEGVDEI